MIKLLVSVRSVEEAETALAGGVDLIDVKEPELGSLGSAAHSTIQEIIARVGGQVPVSAALGEWIDWSPAPIPSGLTFVKWGPSSLKELPSYQTLKTFASEAEPVSVLYADGHKADSVSPLQIDPKFFSGFQVVLIDTYSKDGSNLFDHLETSWLRQFRENLSLQGIALALAGSLNLSTLEEVKKIGPQWVAVRGAVCEQGRTGKVSLAKIKQFRDQLTN
ncbi:MAG: (5-formylfuran-3-yl)methyl phosphate synthase [Gemmataceae bacterium]|jgi:uncharacterized protein (UPF0264 family)|nr:(5-formylfuran-3-yl)methyl phosphate synthase [Gemmataceae bacterium]